MTQEDIAATLCTIVRCEIDERSWALERPFSNAQRTWTRRAALLLRVFDRQGHVGIGEAAPLPGYCSDTLSDARSALDEFASQKSPLHTLRARSPAAAFAVETALFDLAARREAKPLHRWLIDRMVTTARPVAPLATAYVVVASDLTAARRAFDRGFRTLKIKMGIDVDRELEALRVLRAELGSSVRLRVDANGLVGLHHDATVAALDQLGLEFLEEPAGVTGTGIPVALDESLQRSDAEELIETCPGLSAVVLKPTALGGITRCVSLAQSARAAGSSVVVSHTLEGPVGFSACCELALALQDPDTAAGLGPNPALAAWAPVVPPQWTGARVSPTEHPGVGVAVRRNTGPKTGAVLVSAAALEQRAVELAQQLQPLRPPDTVAWTARRALDDAALVIALDALGATAVPLHASWTDDERRLFLERVAPTRVLDSLEELPTSVDPAPVAVPDPEAPLAILATSGSGGRPKACVLSRRAFAASAGASRRVLPLGSTDRWLLSMPLAHVGGLSIILRCVRAGAGIVIDQDEGFDADRFLDVVDDHAVTIASLVPTMLKRVLERTFDPPSTLRAILVGGAHAPPQLLEAARERGLTVLPTYGLTEACSQVATRPLHLACESAHENADVIGPPLPGTQLRISNGEIQVRGPTLLSGYVDDEAPISSDGWLRTGDTGELDARGWLRVTGRIDQQIVSGGENVDPGEVEAALRAVVGLRDVCVVGLADPEWGQAVVAVVVGDADEDLMRESCRARLAPFKRPKLYVRQDRLPRTASGKIARKSVVDSLQRFPLDPR